VKAKSELRCADDTSVFAGKEDDMRAVAQYEACHGQGISSSLDQLLINLLLRRVFTILRQLIMRFCCDELLVCFLKEMVYNLEV
jgi:hypothetical protein